MLLRATDRGLYCEAGDFFVDPWAPVPRAVVTHAHGDHLTWGCDSYLVSSECAPIASVRLGEWSRGLDSIPYGEERTINGVRVSFSLRAGETKVLNYLNVIADDVAGAKSLYDQLARDPAAEIRRARDDWNAELAAVFTPGNDRYSGHMPTLETSDRDVLKLYHIGILGHFSWRACPTRALLQQAFCLAARAICDNCLITSRQQVAAHARAHHSRADPADTGGLR